MTRVGETVKGLQKVFNRLKDREDVDHNKIGIDEKKMPYLEYRFKGDGPGFSYAYSLSDFTHQQKMRKGFEII